jgi:hypothetical protein
MVRRDSAEQSDCGKQTVISVAASEATLAERRTAAAASDQCPLYPQKRTLEIDRVMSALCQKQTFAIPGFRLPSATDADVVASVSCQSTVCRREKMR